MSSSSRTYSTETKVNGLSRVASIFPRVPLAIVTLLFTVISSRYLFNPVRTATAAGISFISPGGITTARIGFAAFPLAFAILAFACLISPRRVLAGLYLVFTVVGVVTVVRIIGVLLDHSASQSARLLIPEIILLTLSIIAIRLELKRRLEVETRA